MNFETGTILRDRYEIKRLLGKGGMGAVYQAYDKTLQTDAAVKINQSSGEQSSTQFLQEARLLATLRHPNLPRVTDHFIIDENEILVMDLIEGDDLDTMLSIDGKMPVKNVIKWARQLGSALDYMHNQTPPVIHRDIKPANIKLTASGDAMLVDFGIAKATDKSQATSTGASGYTPGFAPPEQISRQGTGPYSDQYSLAATLYVLLSGVEPADSVDRVLGVTQLAPLQSLVEEIPIHIEKAIERALSVQPDNRFASVQEFLKALSNPNFIPTPPMQPPVPDIEIISGPYSQPWTEQPPEPVKQGLPGWLVPLALVFVFLVVAGIAGGVWIFTSSRSSQLTPIPSELQVAQIAQQTTVVYLSATPTPSNTPTASSTPLPTITPQFTASQTNTPTKTFTPTVTATLKPIGGGSSVIAFSSDRGEGNALQIWLMYVGESVNGNPAVNNFEQLTFGDGDKQSPAWSPNGRKLLYSAPAMSTANGIDIWMLDLDSPDADPVDLSQQPGDETEPTWSPDGTIIAFNYSKPDSDIRLIYFMNPDSSDFHAVSYEFETYSEFSPVFSPDMQYLVYVSNDRDTLKLIVRKQKEGYAQRSQFDQKSGGELGEVIEPDWPSSGDLILYTLVTDEEKTIYSAPFSQQGEEFKLLTTRNTKESQADWSPDMEWIVFSSERDGNAEIYIMTATGGIQTNLSNNAGRDIQPDWQGK
jgi:eukaryotic-like serine/threonine-protein kinase